MRLSRSVLSALGTALLFTVPVYGDSPLLFDSFDGSTTSSSRPAEASLGSLITISSPITLTNIAVRNDLALAGELRFVVFSHPDHVLLSATPSKTFTDDGMSWKTSDDFSLPLAAGSYDIGAVPDVAANWAFDVSAAPSQNGMISTVNNPNFSGYVDPIVSSHSGGDGAVRLYGFLPEPGTLGLAFVAMGTIVARRARRSS